MNQYMYLSYGEYLSTISNNIDLKLLHNHIVVSVPSQDLDFQRHMSLSFLCTVSSVKMRRDGSFCWNW
jgi:hypothetical protein